MEKSDKTNYFIKKIEIQAEYQIRNFFKRLKEQFEQSDPRIDLQKNTIEKALKETPVEYGALRMDLFFNKLGELAIEINKEKFVAKITDNFMNRVSDLDYMFNRNQNTQEDPF